MATQTSMRFPLILSHSICSCRDVDSRQQSPTFKQIDDQKNNPPEITEEHQVESSDLGIFCMGFLPVERRTWCAHWHCQLVRPKLHVCESGLSETKQ